MNAQNLKNQEIEEVLKSWNIATVNSINEQMEVSKNETFKSLCKNRILALGASWKTSDFKEVNNSSTRYKFLKEILSFKNSNDFYIIEADKSGEYVRIQNYVIYKKNKKVEIYRFDYTNEGWKVAEKFTIKGNIDIDPYKYYYEFGSGVNANDVIITHFTNKSVEESYYYLFSTMRGFSLVFNFI
jgi:hypothetical protein